MKKIGVFSYRVKLILIWCVVILLATGMVSLGLTYNATRQMLEDQKAHLELLTEQVLINFINQTEAVARQLNNQVNSTGLSPAVRHAGYDRRFRRVLPCYPVSFVCPESDHHHPVRL